MVRLRFFYIIFLVVYLSGCASWEWNKMALTKGQTNIDTTKKSIAMLSVKISNQNKPDYQLEVTGAYVVPKPISQTKFSDRIGNQYNTGKPYRSEDKISNEYLLSFELNSGINSLIHFIASHEKPPLVATGAYVPLNMELYINPNTVSYLGHINIVLREKKSDNEEVAGIVPLIDSAVIGFSTGTFDVIVEDKFEEDMKLFTSEYPGLKDVQVEKSILPEWVRPENQNISNKE